MNNMQKTETDRGNSTPRELTDAEINTVGGAGGTQGSSGSAGSGRDGGKTGGSSKGGHSGSQR